MMALGRPGQWLKVGAAAVAVHGSARSICPHSPTCARSPVDRPAPFCREPKSCAHRIQMSDSEDSGTPTASTPKATLQFSSSEDVKAIISEHADLLSEKRAATRCGALGKLRDIMCSHNCCEELDNWKESLCGSFSNCFRSGNEEEQLLALRCSTLLVFTLAPSGEDLAERLETSFQKLKSGLSPVVAANLMLFRCSVCWMHCDLRATTALMGEVSFPGPSSAFTG